MAGLPPDGEWLVQSENGIVFVFNQYTDEEIVSFPAKDANAAAIAQKTIYESTRLTDEQKCYAHFWTGYFYAHLS